MHPLEPVESLNKFILMRCSTCGTETHVRPLYVLEKLETAEAACGACKWLNWAEWASGVSRSARSRVDVAEAERHAVANGFRYIRPLSSPSLDNDPHLVQCERCLRITADRLGDISWGCSCARSNSTRTASGASTASARRKKALFRDSGVPSVDWWDHDANNERIFDTAAPGAHREAQWRCPTAGHAFTETIAEMTKNPRCPGCAEAARFERDLMAIEFSGVLVSHEPVLAAQWADEASIGGALVNSETRYWFKCADGHRTKDRPLVRLIEGCRSCAYEAESNDDQRPMLPDEFPELAELWHPTANGRWRPENVTSGSKRRIVFLDPRCGHTWDERVGRQLLQPRYRCPLCRTLLGSLAYVFPDLAVEWSPLNRLTAWQVRPTETLAFTPEWICSTHPEHRWSATLSNRANGAECPDCREVGKSAVEIDHYEAAKRIFGNARSGQTVTSATFTSRNGWVVDIVIETASGSVAVEYDGAYWHIGREERDERKSRDLLQAGYAVVRLREDGLGPLAVTHPRYVELPVHSTAPRPTATMQAVQRWVQQLEPESWTQSRVVEATLGSRVWDPDERQVPSPEN